MNTPPEKIQKSASLQCQILDRLPDIIVAVNLKGIITYVNPAFETVSGYPLNVIENKHFSKMPFFHSKDIRRLNKIFANIIKNNKYLPFEIEWVHKDGSPRCSEVRIIVPGKLASSEEFIAMARDRTQEMLASRKLAKAMTLLEISQQNGNIGSWEFDLKTNELLWTDELYRIYGIDRQDKPSLDKVFELVHPDDLKRVEALWDDRLLQEPFENDFRIVTNGKTKWIHSYTETIYDENGTATKVFGTEQDVSQRKFSELELQESQLKYESIFNAVNDGLFFHDAATGEILDVNEAACEMTGYTREEILNSTVGDISANVPPYSQDEAIKWIKKAAAGRPQRFEWNMKHKSGRLFWVEVNMRLMQLDDKKWVVVAARDIDNRKQLEKDYLKLVNEIGEGFFTCNAAGEVTFANRAMCKLFGYKNPNEMEGLPFYINIPAEAKEKFRAMYAGFVADRKFPPEVEMSIIRTDGISRIISLRMTPVFEQNNFMGTTGFVMDITESKHAAQNLADKARELEEFNNAMIDREMRVIELKEEINLLCKQMNLPARYAVVWDDEKDNDVTHTK